MKYDEILVWMASGNTPIHTSSLNSQSVEYDGYCYYRVTWVVTESELQIFSRMRVVVESQMRGKGKPQYHPGSSLITK